MKKVLYLDVDGVLQYVENGFWKPRLESEEFLKWAVQNFECRWLTSWKDPNATIPAKLGIKVPPGITETNWHSSNQYPFKAAAISDNEDWLWLEDAPSEFDLADLKRRGQLSRLVLVDAHKPFLLLGLVRNFLENHLREVSAKEQRNRQVITEDI